MAGGVMPSVVLAFLHTSPLFMLPLRLTLILAVLGHIFQESISHATFPPDFTIFFSRTCR